MGKRWRLSREDADGARGSGALAELSVTAEKQHLLGRTALRFDVVPIEEFPSQSPVVRLHKNAFNQRM
jgi:hypothetical protein